MSHAFRWVRLVAISLLLSVLTSARGADPAPASVEVIIRDQLVDFLTHNSDPARHENFWAEDLVYTSSAAAVRTKPMIMASVRTADTQANAAPAAAYSAEDIKVRVYDDFAALTFELVARYPDGRVLRYRNSGAFLLRNGRWQAVTWQATPLPATAAP